MFTNCFLPHGACTVSLSLTNKQSTPQSTYTYIEWYRELWTPKGANFNDARQVSRGVEPPPPLLPHVDLHPITKRRSSSRPMALNYLPPPPPCCVQTDRHLGESPREKIRVWGGEGGSTPRDTCRSSLKLAPKRRPKFPVPLYIYTLFLYGYGTVLYRKALHC